MKRKKKPGQQKDIMPATGAAAPDVAAPPRKAGWGALALVAALSAVVYFVSMPKFQYPGDNFTPRAEAAYWVKSGELGIPYTTNGVPNELKRQYVGPGSERGQYFYENDDRHRLYSKYGIGYTLLYAPLVWMETKLFGDEDRATRPGDVLPAVKVLDVSNAFLATVATVYVFLMTGLFMTAAWRRIAVTFGVQFASLVWYYIRAPCLEPYQYVLFAAWAYHSLFFVEACRPGSGISARRAWLHIGLASCMGAGLFLLKNFYAVLFPAMGLAALLAGPVPVAAKPSALWTGRIWRIALWMGVPVAAAGIVFMWTNHIRFGGWLASGYAQWVDAQGRPNTRFAAEFFGVAFTKQLFRPGNYNLFIHAPLLLAALLGWWSFAKRFGRSALFIGVTVFMLFIPLCFYSGWHGEWCYGPRYLIYLIPLLALPLSESWDLASIHGRKALRWAWRGVIVGLVWLGLWLTVCANGTHYFTWHFSSTYFPETQYPEGDANARKQRYEPIRAYFEDMPCHAIAHRDMARFAEGKAEFPPIACLRADIAAGKPEAIAYAKKVAEDLVQKGVPAQYFKTYDDVLSILGKVILQQVGESNYWIWR